MDCQVLSDHPRCDDVVHGYSPEAQQYGHPDPMTVCMHAHAENYGRRTDPSCDRDELQDSSEDTKYDRVREFQREQCCGIEHQRAGDQNYVGSEISTEHDIQLIGGFPDGFSVSFGGHHVDECVGYAPTVS